MQLETVLRQIDRFPHLRDPEQYAFTIFGNPNVNPWGWRLEGHHLVLHFMAIANGLITITPTFFGANPAEVPVGHLKGLRTLAREQDLGFQLVQSLTPDQRTQTIIATRSLGDIVTDPVRGETPHQSDLRDRSEGMIKTSVW